MAVRSTFSLDESLAEQARELGVNISAAAREGVQREVCRAKVRRHREAYLKHPENADDYDEEAEAWSSDETW